MSLTADRPINWNAIFVTARTRETLRHNLGASDYAAQRGAGVLALAFPMATTARLNFASGVLLDAIPGWAPLFQEGPARRAQILADRRERTRLAELAAGADGMSAYTAWATQTIGETFSAANKGLTGRLVGEVAEERKQAPFDCLLDIVLADDLRTVLTTQTDGDDDETWRLRSDVLCDARVLVGASDAGAHLDMIDGFAFTTDLLGRSVRDRHLFSLERAVQLLTDIPARTYGFRDRGRIELGYCADLVVFDAARIDHGPAHLNHDLPGGASRIAKDALGIDHVFVNGVEIVKGGQLTGAPGGKVLRAGQHTETIHAGAIADRVRNRETGAQRW
jgi:N-acyl-D-aspartate/D-glutamate deacylase